MPPVGALRAAKSPGPQQFHGIISGYTCGGAGEPCSLGNRPYLRQYSEATRGQIAKIVYLSVVSSLAGEAPKVTPWLR